MASLDIQETWSMQQLLEEVEKTTHEISVIDQELDDLFAERVDLEQRVSSLSSLGVELNNVELRAKEMSTSIHSASISGNEISKQVCCLDTAQTRVEDTLSRVTLMLDLKETIKKVEQCINETKYDIAAKETYRILHKNPNQSTDIKQIDEVSYEILQDLEYRLIKLIKMQCENAKLMISRDVNDDNDIDDEQQERDPIQEVIKYASLYPYLGNEMKWEGLDIYCWAINKELQFNVEEQNLTLETQATDSIINYVSIIEGYIDMIFTTITQNENELKYKFIACYPILKLVEILHNETDLSLSKLLNHYIKTNELNQLLDKITGYNRNQHSNLMQNNKTLVVGGSMEMDIFNKMKEVTPIAILDKILDEISHISQELMAYDTTMRALIKEQEEEEKKEEKDEKEEKDNLYKLPTISKIGSIRTRLTGDYILFEKFNMEYQIYRVLIEENNIDNMQRIDHIDDDNNNYKSTISGAIYYLLKTLAIRAFNTYDVNVSCAIVNNICNSLESIYKEWLDKTLRCQPGQRDKTNIAQQFYQSTKSLYTISGGSQSTNSLNHKKTIILLNSIDESISDTNLITNQLEEEVNQIFDGISEKDKFKIRQTLKGFEDIQKSFERIIERGIYRYSSTFYNVLQESLNKFKDYNYEITDKQFNNKQNASNNNNNDQSFVDVLINESRPTFYALSKRLTNNNFDRILIYILSYYLNELERFILYHQFTFWGGMTFDKNRQKLQSYFSELTNTRSIRDQFVRIRSIAEILQFSKINEAINYVNDFNITSTTTSDQTLTPDEIKKFLSLRTEFNQYDIQQLQI